MPKGVARVQPGAARRTQYDQGRGRGLIRTAPGREPVGGHRRCLRYRACVLGRRTPPRIRPLRDARRAGGTFLGPDRRAAAVFVLQSRYLLTGWKSRRKPGAGRDRGRGLAHRRAVRGTAHEEDLHRPGDAPSSRARGGTHRPGALARQRVPATGVAGECLCGEAVRGHRIDPTLGACRGGLRAPRCELLPLLRRRGSSAPRGNARSTGERRGLGGDGGTGRARGEGDGMNRTLLLRLDGPLQSWSSPLTAGRNAIQFPTATNLIGIIITAFGPGDGKAAAELRFLEAAVRADEPGRHVNDFESSKQRKKHPATATEDAWIRVLRRGYATDAVFTAAVVGSAETVELAASALARPWRQLFLGRRCCPPAAPILLGV